MSVVLSLPTIGPVLLTAIQDEDIYLAGFVILMLGTLTVVGTLISDILLAIGGPAHQVHSSVARTTSRPPQGEG